MPLWHRSWQWGIFPRLALQMILYHADGRTEREPAGPELLSIPGVVWGASSVFSASPKKPARGVTISLVDAQTEPQRGEGTRQGRMDYRRQSQSSRCPTANLSASLWRYFIIVWRIQTRSESGRERGALLRGSAVTEKKNDKVLSHLGGQWQRFQEESLLGTSIE